jgi:hypothetical protein
MSQSQRNGDTILGSAELLSPEETADRLRQLARWGVDLSLVQAHLAMTPTERLQRMVKLLAVGETLYQGYIQA